MIVCEMIEFCVQFDDFYNGCVIHCQIISCIIHASIKHFGEFSLLIVLLWLLSLRMKKKKKKKIGSIIAAVSIESRV